ncbi:MAG TPA: hypothetical protein VFG37_09250 [Planctomycetota bacterium]|nr:hypothetical protein [Planctomycetota bacterium]
MTLLAALALALVAAPRSQSDPSWTPLKVVRASSIAGATFEEQPDGSTKVAGPSAERDTYTVELAAPNFAVTALRLEALPDPALPAGGPGRSGNGNFVLVEWRMSWGSRAMKVRKPVTLWHATADFAQEGCSPLGACDGVPGTGWMIFPRVSARHELVVETKGDVKCSDKDVLQVELEFSQGDQNTLGRFRVSATGDERPVRAAGSAPPVDLSGLPLRVNQAIDRGCDWLLTQQQIDGSWAPEQANYRNGATSLCAYALLKSGIRKDHPAIARAVEWLRAGEPRETYTLACQILALHSLEDPAHDGWIKKLGEALLVNQALNGGFNYGFQDGGDLSNMQYAALGLRVAAAHGYKIAPDVWEKMAVQVLATQKVDGNGAYAPVGFSYKVNDKPTGSMTAAGVGILAICDEQLKGHSKSGPLLPVAKRGGNWIAQNFAVDGNPMSGVKWGAYWLYGLERVGALLKTDKFGDHDWYREGARWLCDHQKAEGSWAVSETDVLDTCWALLFLTRATAVVSGIPPRGARNYGADDPRKAVSIRASGDAPLTFWISSFGEAERARLEWPGEEGRGLHVASVEWFAKPLGAAGDPELALGKVERDAKQPCGAERFGGRWSFALPGRYKLRASVRLFAPPAAAGAEPKEVTSDSDALEVNIREVLDPELMDYARDPARNLLRGQRPTVTASSKRDEWWEPKFAVDGLVNRGWACHDTDEAPTLTIELEKPVRASLLLLTPAVLGPDFPFRIRRVQVTLNGKGPPLDLTLASDDHRKTKLRFPTTILRRIELKAVEVAPPDHVAVPPQDASHRGVGFFEVELQVEGGAKK